MVSYKSSKVGYTLEFSGHLFWNFIEKIINNNNTIF